MVDHLTMHRTFCAVFSVAALFRLRLILTRSWDCACGIIHRDVVSLPITVAPKTDALDDISMRLTGKANG
jgi:hypothetical protein